MNKLVDKILGINDWAVVVLSVWCLTSVNISYIVSSAISGEQVYNQMPWWSAWIVAAANAVIAVYTARIYRKYFPKKR